MARRRGSFSGRACEGPPRPPPGAGGREGDGGCEAGRRLMNVLLLRDVVALLLAGGAGERLYPLTRDRAKPAVPFGGPYRIIDFTLSNCINSGLRKIFIATQYKAQSLNRHVRMGWNVVNRELGEFVEILPPQKRVGEHWYLGTADAVY